jgi:hypothetical protein
MSELSKARMPLVLMIPEITIKRNTMMEIVQEGHLFKFFAYQNGL